MSTYERYIISLQDRFSGPMNRAAGATATFASKLSGLQLAIGALGTGVVTRKIIETTSKFERFAAVLTNTLGSQSAAKMAMDNIVDFASKTPFQVDELTSSFVKLANQGFKPSMKEMTKLGDLASSTGKGFDQLTEAIIDAQVGEFERLKEFGIRASKEGDKVTFTFKGQQKQVAFTEQAIRDYILSLGDAAGVSGAMAAISATTGGKISNLQDKITQLTLQIGTALNPAISATLDLISKWIDKASNLIKWLEEHKALIKGLAIVITAAFVPSMVAAIASVVNFTTVFGIMSKVMMVNPFVAIGTALVALGIAMYDAYQRGTKFTAFINGIGSALENLGKRLENTALRIRNVFFAATRQFDRIKQVEKVGESVAKAYSKGYNNTISKFQREAALSGARRGGSGQSSVVGADGTTVAGVGTVGSATKSTPTTITGSAPKVFNINVDKLIDGFTISTTNLTESAGQIKEKVTMALAEALADLQLTAS